MTELPKGWQVKRLADCLEKLKSGKLAERGWSPQCLNYPVQDEGSWGVLKTTSVQMGQYQPQYNKELPASLEPKIGLEVNPGDFLVTTTGPRNRCGIVCIVKNTPKKLIFSGKILRFRVNQEVILANWLMFLLMSPEYQKTLDKLKVGTSDSSVSIGNQQVLDLEIIVPPIDEQHKIVKLLEDHLSRLDAALIDVRQAKVKATQFRHALLQAVFEGSYSATSKNWEKRSIAEFAEVKGGKRLPKGTKWSEEPTLHPYIRATDIKFGEIRTEELVHVPNSVWKSISRYIVEENDVVITIAGTIGDVAVVPASLAGANLTENAAKLVFDHKYLLPSYLSMYLQSPMIQQELKDLSRATTQAKLALYRIGTVEISIPALDEQREIMQLVDEKLSYLAKSLIQIDSIELQITSLRRSLLQAAFTHKFTTEAVSV